MKNNLKKKKMNLSNESKQVNLEKYKQNTH